MLWSWIKYYSCFVRLKFDFCKLTKTAYCDTVIIVIIIVTANRRRKVQQRRSSNKVELKAYNGTSGSRYTVHVWPWSTAYSQLESAVYWFLVREENRRTWRKTLEAEKRTNTNSTHLWRWVRESNPGHIGGRRALSPLHHPCFPIRFPSRFPSLVDSKDLVLALQYRFICYKTC